MLTYLAKTSALLAALLVGTSAYGQTLSTAVCPFKPSELETVMGVSFGEGRAGPPLEASGIKRLNCQYDSKQYSLVVNTTHYLQNPADAKKFATALAGKLEPIPNDPDGAAFQTGQGDLTSPVVHYARNGISVELRVLGIYYKDPGTKQRDLVATREKLAKLRRLP